MPPKKQTPPVTFTLKPRGKGLKLAATHITADPNETQYDFAKRVAQAARLPITRLRATLEPSNRVLDKRSHADNPPKVSDLVGDDGEPVLLVKDLGPQLSWKTVYLIEYVGPIIFHPMFYYLQSAFYGQTFEHSLTLIMVVLHFVKRELESLFVHRFSSDTMPFFYVFRNSGHYWALAGVIFGYIVYSPSYSQVTRTSTQATLTILLYIYFELSNLYTHLTLRNLRPAGTRVRQIPRGYGFDWPFGGITCANYTFDFAACVTIGVWSWCWAVLPFLAVAGYMMDRWSGQKLAKYRREFPDYPRRVRMIPFVR